MIHKIERKITQQMIFCADTFNNFFLKNPIRFLIMQTELVAEMRNQSLRSERTIARSKWNFKTRNKGCRRIQSCITTLHRSSRQTFPDYLSN
jgi:hypothetical protein